MNVSFSTHCEEVNWYLQRFRREPQDRKECFILLEHFKRADLIPFLHSDPGSVRALRERLRLLAAQHNLTLYTCERCRESLDEEVSDYLQFRAGHPVKHLKCDF